MPKTTGSRPRGRAKPIAEQDTIVAGSGVPAGVDVDKDRALGNMRVPGGQGSFVDQAPAGKTRRRARRGTTASDTGIQSGIGEDRVKGGQG